MGSVQTIDKSEIVKHLAKLERKLFFGELRLKIEHGRIVHVRQDQVLKLSDLKEGGG